MLTLGRWLGAVLLVLCLSFGQTARAQNPSPLQYPIVDTGQIETYDNDSRIDYPRPGQDFFGQDAQYQGDAPRYRDNGDGTISDLVTGLMWQKDCKLQLQWEQAMSRASGFNLAGYADWRLPSIKELYSLIDFRGSTGAPGRPGYAGTKFIPYLNTDYFDFIYGDTEAGARMIDAQYWSSNRSVSPLMHHMPAAFGVNFADGRIKGYPTISPPGRSGRNLHFVRYVRGNPDYGRNSFRDNHDGTITDLATGLTWMQKDSGRSMNWREALSYAESLSHGGHSDWRLPNAKELQSLVDYSRAPDVTGSAAIDPLFQCTPIRNEAGARDYAFYWTSTTHLDGPQPESNAVYIAFGRGLGQMQGNTLDVHGAGCQRSDPKTGSPRLGHGPQGDAIRVRNFVRCVRGGTANPRSQAPAEDTSRYPYNAVTGYKGSAGMSGGGGPDDRHPQWNSGGGRGGAQGQGGFGQPGMQGPGGRQGQGRMRGPGGMQGPMGGQGMGRGMRGGGPGGDFITSQDRDGDGRVSRREFRGPPRHFDVFDRDRDGYISADEAPPMPGSGRGPGMSAPGGHPTN